MHERHSLVTCRRMEIGIESVILVELILPWGLEIQCVDKEHHHVRIYLVDDFRNPSGSLVGAPLVDFIDSGTAGEITFSYLGRIVLFEQDAVIRIDREAFTDPC